MSDQHLVEACKALDPNSNYAAAGAFQPRGTQLLQMIGPLGFLAGWFLSESENVPRYAIVGVTDAEIVLFRAEAFHVGWKPAEIIGRFPRASTKVTRGNGVLVRKLTLEPSGGKVALESPRIGPWHSAGVLAALS